MTNLLGKDIIYTCITNEHQFKVPSDIVKDGISCPKCGAFAIAIGWAGKAWRDTDNIPFYSTTQPLRNIIMDNDEEQPLLTIILQDETSVPKVIYKGQEVKYMRRVEIDWEPDSTVPGIFKYAIENAEKVNGRTVINRIERERAW